MHEQSLLTAGQTGQTRKDEMLRQCRIQEYQVEQKYEAGFLNIYSFHFLIDLDVF